MTREEIIRNLKYTMKKHKNDTVNTFETNISLMCKDILDYLEQQPSDTVSRGAFEQVMWERDVAIGQLKELGYGLGQKVEPCDDAISRKAVLDLVNADWKYEGLETDVASLPPVMQKYGKWIDGKCNKCGTHAPFWSMATTYYCSEYCPKCGAKMKESEEV